MLSRFALRLLNAFFIMKWSFESYIFRKKVRLAIRRGKKLTK